MSSVIGFIGTGNIGNPMAVNLVKAGHPLVVHDRAEQRTANLIELGATWADSPAAVASSCELIFLSLPGPPEVEAVLTGPAGILEGAQPGAIVIDLSTNLPDVVQRLAAVATEHDVTLLDSPVSNGVEGARNAELTIMVGGDEQAFERCRPLFETIGNNVHYMGALGNGALIKLINNMIIISNQQLLVEATVLMEKAGLQPEAAYAVLRTASAASHLGRFDQILRRDFDDPSFALTLAAKDVRLALQVGRQLGLQMPLASAASDYLARAEGRGLGGKAVVATLGPAEEDAGIT